MINTTIHDRCEILIDSKISERRKILTAEMHKVNRLGAIGIDSNQLYQLVCSEFKTRGTIIWQGIVKAHRISGSTHRHSLKDNFKQEFYNYIREAYLELTFILQSMDRNLNGTSKYKLDDIQAQIIEKYGIEIDVYVDSMIIPENFKAED
jgi:hypothetical protein